MWRYGMGRRNIAKKDLTSPELSGTSFLTDRVLDFFPLNLRETEQENEISAVLEPMQYPPSHNGPVRSNLLSRSIHPLV